MQRALSFAYVPALATPLRFMLGAPLFALLAALLLLWQGPSAFASRWDPATLALTHLFTLGFLSSAMIGALMQILPAVGGIPLPGIDSVARVVHVLLCLGTLLLACAFLWVRPWLFQLAVPCLVGAFATFIGSLTIGLWHANQAGAAATIAAVRLALAALTVTVALGAALGLSFALPSHLSLPLLQLTGLHVLWGLAGWVGLLVIGVAYQVVPMFQVTPLFPRGLTGALGTCIFLLLLAWSGAAITLRGQPHWSQALIGALLLAAFGAFATTTLRLLWQSTRRAVDAPTLFWLTAMGSLAACALVWLQPAAPDNAQPALTLGVLFIFGFASSTVNGMLYKIVPFLLWYHLRNGSIAGKPPSIRELLPETAPRRQYLAHLCAVFLLLGATFRPDALTRPAALALFISTLWLWLNLLKPIRIYRTLT